MKYSNSFIIFNLLTQKQHGKKSFKSLITIKRHLKWFGKSHLTIMSELRYKNCKG
jgi:hypothetical protein